MGVFAATATAAGASSHAASEVFSFRSAPNLKPMRVHVGFSRPGSAPGLVFVDPFSSGHGPLIGQAGALILDQRGNPVWFRRVPAGQQAVDFRAQTLAGKPVLTWWQGTIAIPPRYTNLPPGSPEPGAKFLVYDQRYRQIATVMGKDGWTADLHEMLLTPSGSALIAVAKEVPYDLRPYGGPQNGTLEDSGIQEINVKTGKLVYQWDMLAHVPLSESQVAVPSRGVWDPFHLNSVEADGHGHLLISARDTWAIYEISRADGKVLWQLGGKGATVKTTSAARFAWQHDARFRPDGEVSLFDDGCCNLPVGRPLHYARGLVLKIDLGHRRATVAAQYEHQPPLYVPSQGNTEFLPDGNVFVGWGQLPYYSEFTRSGKLLLDVEMPGGDESYRAFLQPWTGVPYYAPRLAVVRGKGRARTVFASWNGATQVAGWEVLGASGSGPMKVLVRRAQRRGFETGIGLSTSDSVFQVRALDARGRELRDSPKLTLSPGGSQGQLAPTY